jgi:hypothetical protein
MRLGEIELIFQLPQPRKDLPNFWAGILATLSTKYSGSQLQNHAVPEAAPVEQIRLSLLTQNFNLHVSQIQLHLHLRPNIPGLKVQGYLHNFFNEYKPLLNELTNHLPAPTMLRVAGKSYFSFKTIHPNPQDLIGLLHKNFIRFPSLGLTREFRLQLGYEDQNHGFKFVFIDYQSRQLPNPPPAQVSLQQLQQYPLVENGVEVYVELIPLKSGNSLASSVVNTLRLYALTLDSIPMNFLQNLKDELVQEGGTLN